MHLIQRQLGHANLGITSIYLQGIDTEEIVKTVFRRPPPTSRRRPRSCGENYRWAWGVQLSARYSAGDAGLTVELVRALCDKFARGEHEAAMAGFADDVELISPGDVTGVGEGPARAREKSGEGFVSFLGARTDHRYEVRDATARVTSTRRGGGRADAARRAERRFPSRSTRSGPSVTAG